MWRVSSSDSTWWSWYSEHIYTFKRVRWICAVVTGADIDALCVGPGIHPVFTSFSEKLIAQKEVKDMQVSHISAKLYIILYSSYMVNGISLLNMWLTTFLYCRPFFLVIKLTFDRIEFIWRKKKIATLEIKFCLRVSSTSLFSFMTHLLQQAGLLGWSIMGL